MLNSCGYKPCQVPNQLGHQLEAHSRVNWRCGFVLVAASLALLLSAIQSTAGDATNPGSSQPPDTTRYTRPAIPQDLILGRQPPHATLQVSGPPILISFPVDVAASSGSGSYSEPSIAVNPQNPNQVVVHGGFRDWNNGTSNAALFGSADGGLTWNKNDPINPPPNGGDDGPADTTIYYGSKSRLFGSFLAGALGAGCQHCARIYTGYTTSPFGSGTFQWRTTGNPPVVASTELIAGLDNDQPWVVVNSHRPNLLRKPATGFAAAQPNFIIPSPALPLQEDVYVAYTDEANGSAPVPRVAVSPGGDPPDFTVDLQDGSVTNGPNIFINPGHRLAVAPRTFMPNGPAAVPGSGHTLVTGLVYSLYQTCGDCSGDSASVPSLSLTNGAPPPLVKYMLNRTRDGGASWGLNGFPMGVEVDEAYSQQGSGAKRKFGTVNQLLGGVDAIAVDPKNGLVYVVYGTIVDGFNLISAAQLYYDDTGTLFSGPRVPVSLDRVQAALPSVAVAANGVVGVLYDTFEGNDLTTGMPAFSAHISIADGNVEPLVFTDYTIFRFLSPSSDDGKDDGQRVWGDFQQMVAVGNKFYGVFAGNAAAFGKTSVTQPIFFTADVSM